MKKADVLIILFFIIASVFTLNDLFIPGMYTSHDGLHQVARLYHFDKAIKDGHIPPRWAGGLVGGLGYPLFIFSYTFPWIIGEALHLFGLSIIESIKMTFLIGFAASGIGMYLWQKTILNRLSAFTGAVLYILAPYRFSNIFVRAAIGDATVLAVAPFAFWAIVKMSNSNSWKWIALGSIAISAMILSHAMVFSLFIMPLFLYFVTTWFLTKQKIKYLKRITISGILSLGISAYYLIPSIMELGNTQFQAIMRNAFVGSYFAGFKELLYSPWGYGVFHAQEGGMSLQVGIAQWACVPFAILLSIGVVIMKGKKIKKKSIILAHGVVFFLVFWFAIWMMLPVSKPAWEFFTKFILVDFPLRFLAVAVFAASVLAAGAVQLSKKAGVFVAFFLILISIYSNRNHIRINEILPWDETFIVSLERTTNSFDEYLPRWVSAENTKNKKPEAEILEGVANFTVIERKTHYKKFQLEAESNGKARINTLYYPGWELTLNNSRRKITYDSGFIDFEFKKGSSDGKILFAETPLRKMSNTITLVSLVILASGFILLHFQMYNKGNKSVDK